MNVAELRDEIRDLLDISEYARGNSGFKSRTLQKAVEAFDTPTWGGAPSLRGILRDELGLEENGGRPLRKAELIDLRDALQEVADGE